jgi:hypothetical protein
MKVYMRMYRYMHMQNSVEGLHSQPPPVADLEGGFLEFSKGGSF